MTCGCPTAPGEHARPIFDAGCEGCAIRMISGAPRKLMAIYHLDRLQFDAATKARIRAAVLKLKPQWA